MIALRYFRFLARSVFCSIFLLAGTAQPALPGEPALNVEEALGKELFGADLESVKRRMLEQQDLYRPALMRLIDTGTSTQVLNAAALLQAFQPPFTGVKQTGADSTAQFLPKVRWAKIRLGVDWLPANDPTGRWAKFSPDAYRIYARFVAESDERTKLRLDELLMSGEGMLLTFAGRQLAAGASDGKGAPVQVYGAAELSEGLRRIAVLEGIGREFRDSSFVDFSQIHIGDILLEMFLFDELHDISLLKSAVDAYSTAFEWQLKLASAQGRVRIFDDVGVKLAVASFLLGDAGRARATLKQIESQAVKNSPTALDIDQFYIKHFLPFFSRNVEMFLNTGDFVTYFSRYIENNGPQDVGLYQKLDSDGMRYQLSQFTDYLDAFENTDYKVVVYSTSNRDEAVAQLKSFRPQVKKSGAQVELEVVGGNPRYGIATVERFARPEAMTVRDMLIKAGLPAEAYIWRPGVL